MITILTPNPLSALCSRQQVLTALDVTTQEEMDEADFLIAAVSSAIQRYCAVQFPRVRLAEQLPGTNSMMLELTRRPLVDVETVTEDDNLITSWQVAAPELGTLYKADGWPRGSWGGGWDYIAFASDYIRRSPHEAPLRYFVTYNAGFWLPDQDPGDIPMNDPGPFLPEDIQLAAIETIRTLYQSEDAGGTIASKRLTDAAVTYTSSGSSGAGLPPRALRLLRPWTPIRV